MYKDEIQDIWQYINAIYSGYMPTNMASWPRGKFVKKFEKNRTVWSI